MLNFSTIPEGVWQAVLLLLAPHLAVKTTSDLKAMFSSEKGDPIMDQKETEIYTRCSFWTLRRAELEGKLKVLHAGRKRLYRQSDIEKYLLGE